MINDEELETIAKWPFEQGWHELMAYVRRRWQYADAGYWKESVTFGNYDEMIDCYNISTGGWSGNEELISALRQNVMAWSLCWVQERRGGHYIFEIRRPNGNYQKEAIDCRQEEGTEGQRGQEGSEAGQEAEGETRFGSA